MSKFQMLIGGGETSVTTHRVGHRNKTVSADQAQKIVHLSNLPFTLSELELIQLCDELGIKLERVQYPVHGHGPLEGQPKGFAFLECSSAELAQAAIGMLNNRTVFGRYTLAAQIFAPSSQDDTKLHGFSHLKRRNREMTGSAGGKGGGDTYHGSGQGGAGTSVDGVPYNVFVRLLADLDGVTEDDLSPIFDLPAMKVDQSDDKVTVDWSTVPSHAVTETNTSATQKPARDQLQRPHGR